MKVPEVGVFGPKLRELDVHFGDILGRNWRHDAAVYVTNIEVVRSDSNESIYAS